MVSKDSAHAIVSLEEDGEEAWVLEGNLKTIEGVTCAIHASEEVKDDVMHG